MNQAQSKVWWAELKLAEAVNAPVAGGVDPTLWLPDEMLSHILIFVPFGMLIDGRCALVCKRWARLCAEKGPVMQRRRNERWRAYEAETAQPTVVTDLVSILEDLTVGPDGTIYGGIQHAVHAWSPKDGHHIGGSEHTRAQGIVATVMVGRDSKVYTGLSQGEVQEWQATGEKGRVFTGCDACVTHLGISYDPPR